MTENKEKAFLLHCDACKRKHRMVIRPCPECRQHDIPMPASEWVRNNCRSVDRCDGCRAYRDRY